MATALEVIFTGPLAKIDMTRGSETVENTAGILGTYGSILALQPVVSELVSEGNVVRFSVTSRYLRKRGD